MTASLRIIRRSNLWLTGWLVTVGAAVWPISVQAQQSPSLSQLQAAFGNSNDVKVVVTTVEEALADLQSEYQQAVRESGSESSEAKSIAGQIQSLKSQMAERAAQSRQSPAAKRRPNAQPGSPAADGQQEQLQVSNQQLDALQAKYVEMVRQLGVNHPSVVSLDKFLRQIESGMAGQPQRQQSPVQQQTMPPSANRPPAPDGQPMVDPLVMLMTLTRQVADLQEEIRGLRQDVRVLRSELVEKSENRQSANLDSAKPIASAP